MVLPAVLSGLGALAPDWRVGGQAEAGSRVGRGRSERPTRTSRQGESTLFTSLVTRSGVTG